MPVTIRTRLAGIITANTLESPIAGYFCNANIIMATVIPRERTSLFLRHCKLVAISPKSIEVAIENMGERGDGRQKPVAARQSVG